MKIKFEFLHVITFLILLMIVISCNDDMDGNPQVDIYEGCCDTAPVVATLDTGAVYIPNLITPNGDGFNDYLSPYCGLGIEIVNSFIVKKEGVLIFSAENLAPSPFPDWSNAWNARDTIGNAPYVLYGLFDVEVIVTTMLGTTETLSLKVCSHPCDGTGDTIENGETNCNMGSQHNGAGGLDVTLPMNEVGCF